MKSRWWKGAFLGILAGSAALCSCFVSYGGPDRTVSFHSLEEMLLTAKRQESAVTGEDPAFIPDSRFLTENRRQNDIRIISATGQCLRTGEEQVFYVIGKNYEPEGSILPVMFGSGLEYSSTEEGRLKKQDDCYVLTRFAVKKEAGTEQKEPPEEGREDGRPEKSYWNLGDKIVREIGGIRRSFCCIDQDYQGGALFLCDSVIPSDTGSRYEYERLEDGTHGYRFYPGPIVNFGDSSEYRESRIRGWLNSQEYEIEEALRVNTGVNRSYMGRTAGGAFSQLVPDTLISNDLGSQRLMDKWFILSVDEALKYRKYLWETEESDLSAFAGGYWLRSPMGDSSGKDSGYVYIVDLSDGSIRPYPIKPGTESENQQNLQEESTEALPDTNGPEEDKELAVTSPIGIRPAFVLPQRN